jgi:hypothetical protein
VGDGGPEVSFPQPPFASKLLDDIKGACQAVWVQWFQKVQAVLSSITSSGPTAGRPTKDLYIGQPYFDQTLGVPVYWNGTAWVTAAPGGAVAAVTASAPITSTGGVTPNIAIPVANASQSGYLSNSDWVRFNASGGGGSAVVSNSGTPYTGAITRLVSDMLGDYLSILDFGAVADGVTDNLAAFNAAIAAATTQGKAIYIPAGAYLLSDTVTITSAVSFKGDPCSIPTDTSAPTRGTWLYFAHNNIGFDINLSTGPSTARDGVMIDTIATFRSTQLTSGSPYTPVAQGADFHIFTEYNNTAFHNLVMLNPYIGINFTGINGLYINGLRANPLYRGIVIDNCYDTCYITDVHLWWYWYLTLTTVAIQTWLKANAIGMLFYHVDNPMLSNVFIYGFHNGLRLDNTGVPTSTPTYCQRLKASNLDIDLSNYGIAINSPTSLPLNWYGISVQIDNYAFYGVSGQAGAGIYVSGINCILGFGSTRMDNVGDAGVILDAGTQRCYLSFAQFSCHFWGTNVTSSFAISNAGTGNVVVPGNVPDISNFPGTATNLYQGAMAGWGMNAYVVTRSVNTTYYNSYNLTTAGNPRAFPIYVTVSFNGAGYDNPSARLGVGFGVGTLVAVSGITGAFGANWCYLNFIVPPGSPYHVDVATGNAVLQSWVEYW